MPWLGGKGDESVKAEKSQIFCDLGLPSAHSNPSHGDHVKHSKSER